jgi:hypothetical protein
MGEPTNKAQVAVMPLVSPFSSVTIFTNNDAKATPELGFKNREGSWVTMNLTGAVTITDSSSGQSQVPPASTKVVFSWDSAAGAVHYASYANNSLVGTPSEGNIPTTQGTAVTSSTSFLQSTSTPITSPLPSTSAPLSSDPFSQPSQTSRPPASSTASPVPGSSNGLSGGAVAGVAIGCLLAGALVAGLVAWFFFRRKKSAGARNSEASSMALIHREKGPTAKAVSLESGSPIAAALENGLPLPLEDKAIGGEISKISNLIKNHVQSYYHTGRVSPALIDYDDLQSLGSDMPVSVGTLSTLLGNSATREIALRFCIAWVVISRVQLESPPYATFLPPEISKCIQAMAIGEHSPRGKSP